MQLRAIRRGSALAIALAVLSACGSADPTPAPAADAGAASRDAAPTVRVVDSAVDAAPPPPPKRIFTKRFVVNVRNGPSREAHRIGYLRAGSVFMAKTGAPVGHEGCRGGWYELDTGGFVCAGRDVIAFEGRRLPAIRARQPRFDRPLPYQFGFIRRRVPMYRRLPSDEEAAEFEGYRIPGQAAPDGGLPSDGGAHPAAHPAAAATPPPTPATPPPTPATPPPTPATPPPTPATPPPTPATPPPTPATAPSASPAAPVAAAPGSTDPASPATEVPEEDAVETLDALAGESDSVVTRWVTRGFFVSLDRDFRRGRRRYWRTQSNGFVPYSAVVVRDGSEYVGVELSPPLPPSATPAAASDAGADSGANVASGPAADSAWRLPVGWVLSSRSSSYTEAAPGRLRRVRRPPGYHHAFRLVARREIRGRAYVEDASGTLYRESDVAVAELSDPPSEVPEGGKWLDVDLTRQVLVAYEGHTPVYTTLISSGRIDQEDHPDLDHRTPTGVFQISSKHLTHTMDGDNAIDGPYSIDDVPYVMYFQLAFALHSAFWHNAFGRPKSHGCINMSPPDARHIFDWAGPRMPAGWHGIYPTEDNPSTYVRIRGETPH